MNDKNIMFSRAETAMTQNTEGSVAEVLKISRSEDQQGLPD